MDWLEELKVFAINNVDNKRLSRSASSTRAFISEPPNILHARQPNPEPHPKHVWSKLVAMETISLLAPDGLFFVHVRDLRLDGILE